MKNFNIDPLLKSLLLFTFVFLCSSKSEKVIFPAQINQISLSSSDLGRRQFLNFVPTLPVVRIAFFDADGTLRITKSGDVTPKTVDDVYILPHVREKIKELRKNGYVIAFASNQGGIAKGFLSLEAADQALSKTRQLIGPHLVDYYDFAEEYKTGNNVKPNTGMGVRLIELLESLGYEVDLKNSIMVGDAGDRSQDFSDSDRGFADNLGVNFIHARDFFEWPKELEKKIKSHLIDELNAYVCKRIL